MLYWTVSLDVKEDMKKCTYINTRVPIRELTECHVLFTRYLITAFNSGTMLNFDGHGNGDVMCKWNFIDYKAARGHG